MIRTDETSPEEWWLWHLREPFRVRMTQTGCPRQAARCINAMRWLEAVYLGGRAHWGTDEK